MATELNEVNWTKWKQLSEGSVMKWTTAFRDEIINSLSIHFQRSELVWNLIDLIRSLRTFVDSLHFTNFISIQLIEWSVKWNWMNSTHSLR